MSATTVSRAQAPARTEAQQIDYRLNALNSLLTTPHGDLSKVWPVHQQLRDEDPLFYVRLAAWYADTGDVRDHNEMFVVSLCLSDFPGHRDVGLALLRDLPPYQVGRVVDFICGTQVKQVYEEEVTEKGKTRKVKKSRLVPFGLNRTAPGSLKTEVARYLREREEDRDRFESAVLVARKTLKRLYAKFQIKPSEDARKVLFENGVIDGGRLAAVKAIQQAKSPAEQAQAIVTHKVPYRLATTVVSNMTPTVLAALIEVMSPQELVNSIGMLKKRGAMENPDLKALIEAKLAKAGTGSKKVSALKVAEAVRASGVEGETKAKLEAAGDRAIKAKGRIKAATALGCDKSGSMTVAIELSKRIGAMVSAVMDAPFYPYAFDEVAYPLTPGGNDLASWEKVFAGIKANGGTSCGIFVDHLRRSKRKVDQIVLVSDQEEGSSPAYVKALQDYIRETGVTPHTVFVRCGSCSTRIESQMKAAGLPFDSYTFAAGSDYYSLPNLIPYLIRRTKTDLLFDIMEWELPVRKAA